MFLSFFLVPAAFAVCDFADPVLVSDATHTFLAEAHCNATPSAASDSDVSVDTWRLSLDATDVAQIIDGTCSIAVDNGTVDWEARTKSSIGGNHDKMYRRGVDATLRLTSLTVYGATTAVLSPDGVSCSGEATASASTLLFQVPETCPEGGADVLLSDDATLASCLLEQTAPIWWTTLTTGTVDVPDFTADNLRDLVLLAMVGVMAPDECAVDPVPAIDVTFEREVIGYTQCDNDQGKIEGQVAVWTPADPATIVLGAAGESCEDAALDVTVLDCVPTF